MAAIAPLIVITGPTASGKTGLALKLARKWGGEIVCADSRTVYKGMDIGTAKPTKTEQAQVRHWLLDIAKPGERFTAADFQRLAKNAIEDIRSRGKVPFLVGGTGLYIDAIVLDFVFSEDADLGQREQLEKLSTEELKLLLLKQQKPLPENQENRRHLIRRIEKNNNITPVVRQPKPDTYVIAISTEKEALMKQIAHRIDEMFRQNIVQETQHLLETYGAEGEALTSNIYPIVRRILQEGLDIQEAKRLAVTKDWQLAKRQITWLRRHDYVHWLSRNEAEHYIDMILRKYRDD